MGEQKGEYKPKNKKIIDYTLALRTLGQNPIDPQDKFALTKITERCKRFYEISHDFDMIPMIEGMALALGVTRLELLKWARGEYEWTRGDIAKALQLELSNLNAIIVQANASGKIKDVPLIYLTKNNYEYTNEDQKPVAVQLNVQLSPDQLIEQAKTLQLAAK